MRNELHWYMNAGKTLYRDRSRLVFITVVKQTKTMPKNVGTQDKRTNTCIRKILVYLVCVVFSTRVSCFICIVTSQVFLKKQASSYDFHRADRDIYESALRKFTRKKVGA